MKMCSYSKCKNKGVLQPTTNFYKKPMTKDGLCEECKDCRKLRQKASAQKKKESYHEFFNLIIG